MAARVSPWHASAAPEGAEHQQCQEHIPGVFPTRAAAPAPDFSLIVSCCPHLRSLKMQQLQDSAELLAPLTGLSELQMMDVATSDDTTVGALQVTWHGASALTTEVPGYLPAPSNRRGVTAQAEA